MFLLKKPIPLGPMLPKPFYFTLEKNKEPWLIISGPISSSMENCKNQFSVIQEKTVNSAERPLVNQNV